MTESYVNENFPFLNFPSDMIGFHHLDVAGYLSPRKLVLAQQLLAEREGCKIVDGKVQKVFRNAEIGFEISVVLSDGSGIQNVLAKKLILAPGAYANLNSWIRDLFPAEMKGRELDLSLKSQTVAYLEVDRSEAERLTSMPAMVTEYSWGPLDGTYILPPILYPDGKYYLKLGHGDNFERTFSDKTGIRNSEIRDWYNSEQGCPEAVQALADFITNQQTNSHFILNNGAGFYLPTAPQYPPSHLQDYSACHSARSLIPDLKVVSVHGGCCVTAVTPGKIGPYIDALSDGVTLVAGGNGYGAKCSDEIGRLGAKLSKDNKWDSKIRKSDCKIIWRDLEQ